jgi:hypothetical protein
MAKGGSRSGKDGIWWLRQRMAMAGGHFCWRQWTTWKVAMVTDEDKTTKGGGSKDGV